jgi:hypothetical protein
MGLQFEDIKKFMEIFPHYVVRTASDGNIPFIARQNETDIISEDGITVCSNDVVKNFDKVSKYEGGRIPGIRKEDSAKFLEVFPDYIMDTSGKIMFRTGTRQQNIPIDLTLCKPAISPVLKKYILANNVFFDSDGVMYVDSPKVKIMFKAIFETRTPPVIFYFVLPRGSTLKYHKKENGEEVYATINVSTAIQIIANGKCNAHALEGQIVVLNLIIINNDPYYFKYE